MRTSTSRSIKIALVTIDTAGNAYTVVDENVLMRCTVVALLSFSTCAASRRANSSLSAAPADARHASASNRTKVFLTFETCGGLTNQRIAVVQGLMAASVMRAVAVLPQLNLNGVQRPQEDYREDRSVRQIIGTCLKACVRM